MPPYACLGLMLLMANAGMFGLGGAIHHWYHHRRRASESHWKLEAGIRLPEEQFRQGLILSIFNINAVTVLFAVLVWGILERGWGLVYFDVREYGLPYLVVSAVGCFLFIEACAYYSHVALHQGWLYRTVHSKHHVHGSPVWFTLASMHPLEWLFHASYIMLAAFLIPMHYLVYFTIVLYTFLAGFWDHCGVKLPFNLPFHGANSFHDDHHKFVHTNFGFLCSVFDRIHDTVRREGHDYSEDNFAGGRGIAPEVGTAPGAVVGGRVRY